MAVRVSARTQSAAPENLVSREAVQALSRHLEEPDWLRDRRLEAWDEFVRAPAPRWQRGVKGWWVTDLTTVRLEHMGVFAGPTGSGPATRSRQPNGRLDGQLVHRNSAATLAELAPALRERGVVFADLPTAVREQPELVRGHLGGLVLPSEGKFTALASALWSSGVFLYVPEGVEVALPLRALVSLESPELALSWRTIIVAERGSRVTYVEELASSPAASSSLFSGAVEIYVGEGAMVEYAKTEAWGRSIPSLSARRARVGRDGKVRWIGAYLGGDMIRCTDDTVLAAPGAAMEMLGLFFADGRQHMDLNSFTVHQAPHTTAEILLNGAVKDAAHAAFAGTIRVDRDAQGAGSHLTNHTLTLSDQARVDAVPSLEIEANDVSVSHGATAGKLDEEQVFYLMTRGLSRAQAARTLVRGFFEPVLSRIPLVGLRERIERALEGKMPE